MLNSTDELDIIYMLYIFSSVSLKGAYNQAFGDAPATVAQPAPPPVIIVQQPQQDPNHVPEIFETDSKDWFLFCAMGYFFGWCTACYLGMKYQVRINLRTLQIATLRSD